MAREAIRAELARVAASLGAPSDVPIELETPREKSHGDVATNLALLLSRPLRSSPRKIAEQLVAGMRFAPELVAAVEVAGPGFINFRLGAGELAGTLRKILEDGAGFGRGHAEPAERVNVEFVSANPTGPLHVAHGRGAALGDCVARLLEWQGHVVAREFYINDAGIHIDRLGESLWARVQQAVGREGTIPEQGYHGAYLVELAEQILREHGRAFADQPAPEGARRCTQIGTEALEAEQFTDLGAFRVEFDVRFPESDLYSRRLVEATLEQLQQRGVLFAHEGALWLRTTQFGDDKDRVLRKSDGNFTYFTPDIAYHEDKAARGFDRAIDVWGADHHGYVPRMRAAMLALGHGEAFFEALIVQLVTVLRHGEEVKMSKRAGEFITLRELVDEVGVDAARYFFLMRKCDTPLAFDVDLATKRTEENPVFYVQMAHARMSGIFRNWERPEPITPDWVDPSALTDPTEADLVKQLARFPEAAQRAAETLEPQRLTQYLEELARAAHLWYHRCRVLGESPAVERSRLALARCAQMVLASALGLLGLTAPERM